MARLDSAAMRLAALLWPLLLAAPARAQPGVTPPGAVLLRFDGGALTPPDVRARLKAIAPRRYEIRYAPKNEIAKYDPVKPLAWALRFTTFEDPKDGARWIGELSVTLLENSEMACVASSDKPVVGKGKVGGDAAMMLNLTVACSRARDGYATSCGGSVLADGTVPTCAHAKPILFPK